MTRLAIADILVTASVDAQGHLDPARVDFYRRTIDRFPPVVVFDTENGLLLVDGYHRVAAALRRGERPSRPRFDPVPEPRRSITRQPSGRASEAFHLKRLRIASSDYMDSTRPGERDEARAGPALVTATWRRARPLKSAKFGAALGPRENEKRCETTATVE